MREINKEEQEKIIAEISEWLGERIGVVDSFILFADVEGEGLVIHSERADIQKMHDALTWLAININQGLKNGQPK